MLSFGPTGPASFVLVMNLSSLESRGTICRESPMQGSEQTQLVLALQKYRARCEFQTNVLASKTLWRRSSVWREAHLSPFRVRLDMKDRLPVDGSTSHVRRLQEVERQRRERS